MNRPDDSASLPGIYVREFVDLCARFEVTPEELLAGSPVRYDSLSDPSTRVGLGTLYDLVRRGVKLTGEPGLAYFMGLHMRVSWHGFLGFAAMTAPTVREALRLAERFAGTRTGAIAIVLHEDEGHGVIVVEERVPLGPLQEAIVIALFSGLKQLAEALTGAPIVADIDLAFPEPSYAERFREIIPGVARYGQPQNRILLGPGMLDRAVITADPVAMQLARDQCERELAALGPGASLIEQVRRFARPVNGEVPSIEDVAQRLRVSTRTLKRRLAEHSTTYSDVVDRIRHQEALLLLVDARNTIDDVAARLGYSDVANFTRAFRRWTGTTPAAHRAKGKATG